MILPGIGVVGAIRGVCLTTVIHARTASRLLTPNEQEAGGIGMTLKQDLEHIMNDGAVSFSLEDQQVYMRLDTTDRLTRAFITHATQRLIDAGYQPDGKAIKAIEGMRDE